MDWLSKHQLSQAVGDIAYEAELRNGSSQYQAAQRYNRAYNGMLMSMERIEQQMDDDLPVAEWLEQVTA